MWCPYCGTKIPKHSYVSQGGSCYTCTGCRAHWVHLRYPRRFVEHVAGVPCSIEYDAHDLCSPECGCEVGERRG